MRFLLLRSIFIEFALEGTYMLLVIQKTLLSIRSAFNFVYTNVVCGMALNLSLLFKDINQEKILVLSELIVRNYS